MEKITAKGVSYEAKEIRTTENQISFSVENGDSTVLKKEFEDVSELTVSGEDDQVYGKYCNLVFVSASVDIKDTVVVTMRIKTDMEIMLEELKKGQEANAGAIEELATIIGEEA